VDQEGAMRRGGAGGVRNWRGETAETADGGGQRSSGEVVEWRREQEYGCVCSQAKKRHAGGWQAAAGGLWRAARLRRAAA
jgi:hypothetical protein